MFIRQLVTRQLAKSQQAPVLGHRVKSHAPPQFFKERIVGVRQGFRQIHVLAPAYLQHRVSRDDIFLQRGDRNRRLDR